MRKKFSIFILPVLTFIAYLIASPFLTVSHIKAAVRNRDSQKLCEKIDFPSLRQNLKSQFNAKIVEEAGTDLDDNRLGSYALAFASTFADGIVEVFVTPEGIAALMEKGEFLKDRPEADFEDTFKTFTEVFRESRFSFSSINSFSVWVSNDVDEEIRFVFRRKGLDWRLSNVIVPELKTGIVPQNKSLFQKKFGIDHLSLCPEHIWHRIKMGGASGRSAG